MVRKRREPPRPTRLGDVLPGCGTEWQWVAVVGRALTTYSSSARILGRAHSVSARTLNRMQSKRLNNHSPMMGMLIKLDVRETRLREMLEPLVSGCAGVDLVDEQLPLGDVLICDDDGKIRVLVERKTLADLASSIVDGRYKEQGARLEGCGLPRHHVFYLIEGDVGRFKGRMRTMSGATLRSSTISMAIIKGFSVHTVSCIGESARWISQLAKRLGSSTAPRGYYEAGAPIDAPAVICGAAKKDGFTPDTAALKMLSQIPGISSATASAITSVYPTIKALVDQLSTDPQCLANIRIVAASGKARRIADNVQKRVLEFLGVV